MKRSKPVKPGRVYNQLWRIVDGAVRDAMEMHLDYFADKRARASINKRVVGAVLGFAEQSARGRSGERPAAVTAPAKLQRRGLAWLWESRPWRAVRLARGSRKGEGRICDAPPAIDRAA